MNLYEMFEKGNFIDHVESSFQNDGIGHTEYGGVMKNDSGNTWIEGTSFITFYGSFSIEEVEDFIDYKNDELTDFLYEQVDYEDVDISGIEYRINEEYSLGIFCFFSAV